MDPIRVNLSASLSPNCPTGSDSEVPAKLADKFVEQQHDGVGRAKRIKTIHSFPPHPGQSLRRFSEISILNNSREDRSAVRLNARLEKFSGRVEDLVGQLSRGNVSGIENPELMTTLSHDAKLLHQDQHWTSLEQIFSTQLDLHLNTLTRNELRQMARGLGAADTSKLSLCDKAYLITLQRAVLRQQFSRSQLLVKLLANINHNEPSNTSGKDSILEKLNRLRRRIEVQVQAQNLGNRHSGRNEDILQGAIRSKLRDGDMGPEKLSGMNRNLLNIEQVMRTAERSNGNPGEIHIFCPELRLLSRAVREEFLTSKVDTFTDQHLASQMESLGSGAAHEVTLGRYKASTDGPVSKIHKYDDHDLTSPTGGRFAAAEEIGIDSTNPRLLERAVFTSRYDAALGFNVSVTTHFSNHRDQIGIVMNLADGKPPPHMSTQPKPSKTAVVQRELIKLQLLDTLTGQADRHSGNYMISQNQEGAITGIKAIDSDFSMAPMPTDPATVVGKRGVHLPHLPPVIDREMAAAIRSILPGHLEQLGDNMFDDQSLESAVKRLAVVKSHINKLEENGRLIESSAWGTPEVTDLLQSSTVKVQRNDKIEEEFTSYWQRDQQLFIHSGGTWGEF